MAPFRIMIIDEIMVNRIGLFNILKTTPNVSYIDFYDNLSQAVILVRENKIDYVMINIDLNNNSVLFAIQNLEKLDQNIRMVLYSKDSAKKVAKSLISMGLITYFRYDKGFQERRYSVSNLSVLLIKNITPIMLERFFSETQHYNNFLDVEIKKELDTLKYADIPKLTPRELHVCQLLTMGKSNREISDELAITRSSVENIINSIYHKFSITGEAKDSSRRVLLVYKLQNMYEFQDYNDSTEKWKNLRQDEN